MADISLQNAIEVFSAPIEGLIVALGKGISEAQAALDQNSIKAQEAIDADPTLSRLGLQATWYQMPQVQLQLKTAVAIAEEAPAQPPSPPAVAIGPVSRFRLVAQPVSAAYQNHFNYNIQGSSTITLSVVPVPSPRAADQSAVTPRLNPGEVQQAALASSAKFVTVKDATGKTVPAPNLRFDMNFNAAARLWYVLQYDPAIPTAKPIVVAVDDVTGSVRIIST